MKNSTLLGSAASVLLAFSVISYSRTYVQQQDPKSVQQPNQTSNPQANPALLANDSAVAPKGSPGSVTPDTRNTVDGAGLVKEKTIATVVLPAQTYTATAYSLRGRTASGKPAARGLIAADPRLLPLGTRVRIEAGEFSGEYVVADTGGMVKGRRVDIWTPTSREAMRFGRRAIKLTVLELGGRPAKTVLTRPRLVHAAPSYSFVVEQSAPPKK